MTGFANRLLDRARGASVARSRPADGGTHLPGGGRRGRARRPGQDGAMTTTQQGQPTARRLSELPEWQRLEEHYAQVKDRHLRDLFAEDPTRGETLTASA